MTLESIDKKFYHGLNIGEKLGEGQFGTTWSAIRHDSAPAEKIKKTRDTSETDDNDLKRLVVKESKGSIDFNEYRVVLGLKPHKNILSLLGLAVVNGKYCLVSELCEYGSLDKLHQKINMTESKTFADIAVGICRGLDHIHNTLEILHKDIACRNVLMRLDGSVVLSDFGMSRQIQADQTYYSISEGNVIPWAWSGPEVVLEGRFTFASDIYSLGVTFWEILSKGNAPCFEGKKLNEFKTLAAICSVIHKVANGSITAKFPSTIPKSTASFVRSCLHPKPERRPSVANLLQSALKIKTIANGSGTQITLTDSFLGNDRV